MRHDVVQLACDRSALLVRGEPCQLLALALDEGLALLPLASPVLPPRLDVDAEPPRHERAGGGQDRVQEPIARRVDQRRDDRDRDREHERDERDPPLAPGRHGVQRDQRRDRERRHARDRHAEHGDERHRERRQRGAPAEHEDGAADEREHDRDRGRRTLGLERL